LWKSTCIYPFFKVVVFSEHKRIKEPQQKSRAMYYPTVKRKTAKLLGSPLGHSISPPMHNRVFETLGMDYCYMRVEVNEKNLQKVFSGRTRMTVGGCLLPDKRINVNNL